MFFLLSKILDFAISPLVWIILLLLLGLFLKNALWKRRCQYSAVLLLLLCTNPWLAGWAMRTWEVPAKSSSEIKEPYDIAIVLGGSMRHYDPELRRVVYSSSADRLLQAIQLYHDKKIRKILLSGGSGFVNFQEWKESALLAEVLLKGGVTESDIILENESRNTFENARNTAAILASGKYGDRFLLVTSAFHMRRSLVCFEKTGLKVSPFSVDTRTAPHIQTLDRYLQPDAENISQWDMLIHEWVGMVMYKMMGYC